MDKTRIYVDTCVLVEYGWPKVRHSSPFGALVGDLSILNAELVIPQPVLDELIARRCREWSGKINDARKIEASVNREFGWSLGEGWSEERALELTRQRLSVLTRGVASTRVCPITTASAAELFSWALQDRPPFKRREDGQQAGFKDAVILKSILDDLSSDGTAFLLSDDRALLAAATAESPLLIGMRNPAELHSRAAEILDPRVLKHARLVHTLVRHLLSHGGDAYQFIVSNTDLNVRDWPIANDFTVDRIEPYGIPFVTLPVNAIDDSPIRFRFEMPCFAYGRFSNVMAVRRVDDRWIPIGPQMTYLDGMVRVQASCPDAGRVTEIAFESSVLAGLTL